MVKKIKICSIIITVLSGIGICISAIKLIAQYNGVSVLNHSGGANDWFMAVKAGDSLLIYIITFILVLLSVILWLIYKRKKIQQRDS